MNFDELAKTGRVDGMPAAEYHRVSACSSSAIRGVLDNPAKYRHKSKTGISGPSIDFGSTVHALACDKFDEEIAVFDGTRNPRHAKYAAFLAENEGKTIITPKILADAQTAWTYLQDHVNNDPEASHILTGDEEVSLFWYETVCLDDGTEVKVPCKARADVLNVEGRYLTDIKTAKDASPRGFAKAAKTWQHLIGYDVQSDWYIRGCEAVFDVRGWTFYFAAVENSAPFLPCAFQLDAGHITDKTSILTHQGLRKWTECWSTGFWPGYDAGINWIV